MFVEYREAEISDFRAISNLANRVFDKYVGPSYSQQGCTVFHKFMEPEAILERYKSGNFPLWVAIVGEEIIGIIGLRNWNHICILFVDGKYQKLGIAKKLFELARDKAIDRKQIKEIKVHSSLYAVEIYKKLGFKALDDEQEQDGIKFFPMKLYL